MVIGESLVQHGIQRGNDNRQGENDPVYSFGAGHANEYALAILVRFFPTRSRELATGDKGSGK